MAEILQDETLQEMSLSDSIESTEFPFIEGVTDISIKVQNTVIHVNSGIIMVASPVLSKMLRSDDKERYKDMIVLPDRNVEDVTLLLKCVYPNKHVRYTGTSTTTYFSRNSFPPGTVMKIGNSFFKASVH